MTDPNTIIFHTSCWIIQVRAPSGEVPALPARQAWWAGTFLGELGKLENSQKCRSGIQQRYEAEGKDPEKCCARTVCDLRLQNATPLLRKVVKQSETGVTHSETLFYLSHHICINRLINLKWVKKCLFWFDLNKACDESLFQLLRLQLS